MNNNAIAVIDAFTNDDVKPVSIYSITLDSPDNEKIRDTNNLELRVFFEMDDWDVNANGLLSKNVSFMEGVFFMMKNLYMLRIKERDIIPANTACQGKNFVTYRVTRKFGDELLMWHAKKMIEQYNKRVDKEATA